MCACVVACILHFTLSLFTCCALLSYSTTVVCFPPWWWYVCVCVCMSCSWVKVSTESRGGYWEETWFLVSHPRTDSPLPRETHFAPKGEINTAANLDSPLSPTRCCSPLYTFPSMYTQITCPITRPCFLWRTIRLLTRMFSIYFSLASLCKLYFPDTSWSFSPCWLWRDYLSVQVKKHLPCWSVLEQDTRSLPVPGQLCSRGRSKREFSNRNQ